MCGTSSPNTTGLCINLAPLARMSTVHGKWLPPSRSSKSVGTDGKNFQPWAQVVADRTPSLASPHVLLGVSSNAYPHFPKGPGNFDSSPGALTICGPMGKGSKVSFELSIQRIEGPLWSPSPNAAHKGPEASGGIRPLRLASRRVWCPTLAL